MTLTRSLSLAARVIVATAWAACLVILGLFLVTASGPPTLPLPLPQSSWFFGGLATLSAGVFLFMTVVADRLIPSIGRRQAMWKAEMLVFATFLLSFVLSIALAIYGDP